MLCTQDRKAVSLDAAWHRHIKSVHIYVDVVMLKQVEQQRTKKNEKENGRLRHCRDCILGM